MAPLDVSVLGIGFDILRLRAQLQQSTDFPKGRIQPYFTAGPVLSIVRLEDSVNLFPFGQKDTDTSVGVKVGTGIMYMLPENVGLFAEFRFTYASADVDFIDTIPPPTLETLENIDISTSHVIFGVSKVF